MFIQTGIPKVCQIGWYSLTGYTAYRLQISCLGNHLESFGAKIATYLPRMLVAIPLLTITAAVDLSLGLFKFGAVVILAACNIPSHGLLWSTLLADFVSLIALPLVLPICLLMGKIPESIRPNQQVGGVGDGLDWSSDPLGGASLDLDAVTEKIFFAALCGSAYTLERILRSIRKEQLAVMLDTICLYETYYTLLYGPPLVGAIFGRNRECLDLLIAAGAKFPLDNEAQLEMLYHASLGPEKNLESILSLSRFDPATTYTLSAEHVERWKSSFVETPEDLESRNQIQYDLLTNLSIAEVTFFASGFRYLLACQKAGVEVNYAELVQFKQFLDDPETDISHNRYYQVYQQKKRAVLESHCDRRSEWINAKQMQQELVQLLQYRDVVMGLIELRLPTNGPLSTLVFSYL